MVFCGKTPGVLAAHHQHADDIFATDQRRHQARPVAGAQGDLVEFGRGFLPQVGDLDRLALRHDRRDVGVTRSMC